MVRHCLSYLLEECCGSTPDSAFWPGTVVCEAAVPSGCEGGCRRGKSRSVRPRNYTWAQLMARVFEVDVSQCDGCGTRMRILADIHSPDAIRAILDCLGLPSRAPPFILHGGL